VEFKKEKKRKKQVETINLCRNEDAFATIALQASLSSAIILVVPSTKKGPNDPR
jgi:hypothetical protein